MESIAFDSITSYLVTRRENHRLVDPEAFWSVLRADAAVDRLPTYTAKMGSMLTGIIGEWYGIHVPFHQRSEWGPPIEAPPGVRVELCLDRHAARRLRHDIASSAYDPCKTSGRLSVFGGWAVAIPDEFALEQAGMEFLVRQAGHFQDGDEYVIVVSTTDGREAL